MPRVDTECEGPGATHYHACKCREEYFATIEKRLKKAVETLKYCSIEPGMLHPQNNSQFIVAKECLMEMGE